MALAPGDAQQELLRLCRTELEEAPCFPEQAGAPWGDWDKGEAFTGTGKYWEEPSVFWKQAGCSLCNVLF